MSVAGIFLDRDGVITKEVYYHQWGEWEAPMEARDVDFLPGSVEALSQLQALGRPMFLLSNQAAHAKGKIPLKNLLEVAGQVSCLLTDAGIVFADEFYSYSHPDGCVPGFSGPSLERKPGTYFPLLAAARYDLDLNACWLIGDRETDIICGQKAGMKTILIRNALSKKLHQDLAADFTANSLLEAAALIRSEL